MAVRTYIEAIHDALQEEMRSDPSVFIIGEDVGIYGGAFRATAGLLEEFGEERLIACVHTHRQLSSSALLHRLFEEVHHFSADGAQADDLTVLVLNYSGGTGQPLTPPAG